jgi:hypothetical protein
MLLKYTYILNWISVQLTLTNCVVTSRNQFLSLFAGTVFLALMMCPAIHESKHFLGMLRNSKFF